mgnify:CR=1 FL=1
MNENTKEFNLRFTVRNVLRALCALCTVFVFCPAFLVSCSGQNIKVSVMTAVGGMSAYGEKVVDPHPIMLVCLLIPVVALVLLFVKKLTDTGILVQLFDEVYIHQDEMKLYEKRVVKFMDVFHKEFPLKEGMGIEEARNKLQLGSNTKVIDAILEGLKANKIIKEELAKEEAEESFEDSIHVDKKKANAYKDKNNAKNDKDQDKGNEQVR